MLERAISGECQAFSLNWEEVEQGDHGPLAQMALFSPEPLEGQVGLVITTNGEEGSGKVLVAVIPEMKNLVGAMLVISNGEETWPCCGGIRAMVMGRTQAGSRLSPAHRIAAEWNGEGLLRLQDRYEKEGDGEWEEAKLLGGMILHGHCYLLLGAEVDAPCGWEMVDHLNEGKGPRRINRLTGEVEVIDSGRGRLFDTPRGLDWVDMALREGLSRDTII